MLSDSEASLRLSQRPSPHCIRNAVHVSLPLRVTYKHGSWDRLPVPPKADMNVAKELLVKVLEERKK
jgi:hypothetical protein